MGDYGRPIEFGYSPIPEAQHYDDVLAKVQLADRLGLDLVGIQDHPYQHRFLDTWTLITALAMRTTGVRFFPDVANLPLRQPAVLAKAAATLDRISDGRVELGIGAGAAWDAIAAMGGPRRTPGEAVDALEDAIAVMRLMWSDERAVRHDGKFYGLRGVHPGPPPAHDIGIWLGARGPRMLALTGRTGDGWIPSSFYVPPEQLPEMQVRIDDAAAAAGRNPAAVRRAYNIGGVVTDGPSRGFLQGPVDQWVEELTRLVVELGMDTFILWPADASTGQFHRFAEEVRPAVVEAVARERHRVSRGAVP